MFFEKYRECDFPVAPWFAGLFVAILHFSLAQTENTIADFVLPNCEESKKDTKDI